MGFYSRYSFDERFVRKIVELQNEYGTELLDIEGIGPESLDIQKFSDKFFEQNSKTADVSVDGNANVSSQTVLSFEHEQGKASHRLYGYYMIWRKMAYDPSFGVKRANRMLDHLIAGPLKFHDAHMTNKAYCFGFSLEELVHKGLPFVNKVKINPPKHLSSYINLVIQFVAYASNQIAGAVALPDFFIYFDYFARKDYGQNYLDDADFRLKVTQELQSFVWSMNFEFRASQSAFTNVSVYDDYFLKDMFSKTVYPDNSLVDFGSLKKLQEFYMRWFLEITKEQTFTFPVNTANLYKDDNGYIKDMEFLDLVSDVNSYNGMFNIYTGPLSSISSCCRLRSNLEKAPYQNSLGAGGISIGSTRVVTLNLAHIAYRSEDNIDFMKKLEMYASYAHDILITHYKILKENVENNKLPLYFYNFMHMSRQFMTTGFIALNECLEILGMDIMTEEGQTFAKAILDKLNSMNEAETKKDGLIRNIEQIPGESAAITFAKKDKLFFPNQKYEIYSNQYIPLWKNVDIQERIRLQGKFDSLCSGGAICHLNSVDSLTKDQMKTLILAAAKAGCIYFAVNMNMARCQSCGKLFIGKFDKSPCHNADMDIYVRVVGFLTKVSDWTKGRREEYKNRQFYSYGNFPIVHTTPEGDKIIISDPSQKLKIAVE